MAEVMHVRLKPYNPNIGHVCKTKAISGHRFVEGNWEPFDLAKPGVSQLLDYLRTVKQEVTVPDGPDAFDVCTAEEARAIRRHEKYGQLEGPAAATAPKLLPPESVEVEPYMSEMNEEPPTHRLDLPPPAPSAPPAPLPPPVPPAETPAATAPPRAPTPPPAARKAPTPPPMVPRTAPKKKKKKKT